MFNRQFSSVWWAKLGCQPNMAGLDGETRWLIFNDFAVLKIDFLSGQGRRFWAAVPTVVRVRNRESPNETLAGSSVCVGYFWWSYTHNVAAVQKLGFGLNYNVDDKDSDDGDGGEWTPTLRGWSNACNRCKLVVVDFKWNSTALHVTCKFWTRLVKFLTVLESLQTGFITRLTAFGLNPMLFNNIKNYSNWLKSPR